MRTTTPVTFRARTAVGIAAGAALVAALAACGSSSGADEAAIASPEEWCEVALEVDAVIGDRTSRNTIHHELQEVYAEARVLVVRLVDGLEHVDPEHRDDVAALGDRFVSFADAMAAAPDQRRAEAVLERDYAPVDGAAEAGADWVAETCRPA